MLLCCWCSTGAPPLLSTDMLATCQQGIHSTLIMCGLTHAQPLHKGDAKVSTVTTWTGLGTADWPTDKMCKVTAVKSISARGAASRIWIPAILALEHRRHRRLVREVPKKTPQRCTAASSCQESWRPDNDSEGQMIRVPTMECIYIIYYIYFIYGKTV